MICRASFGPISILTENGYIIAEIDSVPGGIGLTGWLNQTYSAFDKEIIGGAEGMLDGFQSVLPNGGDIVISQEAATYRPEMEWIAARLNEIDPIRDADETGTVVTWRVVAAENYEPQGRAALFIDSSNCSICRIFRRSTTLLRGERRRTHHDHAADQAVIWKRKCGSRFFGCKPLREFWRRELGEKYFLKLQEVIPYSWLLDPTPLPQHAVIPRLEIHDWREAAKFSQKERDLLLKVSGFSPLGWGSRGVALGAICRTAEWEKRIENALANFERSPTIMQQFHKGRLFEHRY